MLRCLWLGSIHSRLTLASLGCFFSTIRPPSSGGRSARRVPAHLCLFGTSLSPIGEQLVHLGHKLLLPGRHLARMDAEPARQLGRRPVALGGRQGHFSLKRRTEYSSIPSHHPAPDRAPPTREAPPYQGPRNPGATCIFSLTARRKGGTSMPWNAAACPLIPRSSMP